MSEKAELGKFVNVDQKYYLNSIVLNNSKSMLN